MLLDNRILIYWTWRVSKQFQTLPSAEAMLKGQVRKKKVTPTTSSHTNTHTHPYSHKHTELLQHMSDSERGKGRVLWSVPEGTVTVSTANSTLTTSESKQNQGKAFEFLNLEERKEKREERQKDY